MWYEIKGKVIFLIFRYYFFIHYIMTNKNNKNTKNKIYILLNNYNYLIKYKFTLYFLIYFQQVFYFFDIEDKYKLYQNYLLFY